MVFLCISARTQSSDSRPKRINKIKPAFGVPNNKYGLAYKNFKSLIKGLLLYKSKNQQTENGELSLTPDEQKILFDVITPIALTASRALTVTIDYDSSNKTNEEIEALTKILELHSTHPELMRAIFEDAYDDTLVEVLAETTRGDATETATVVMAPL